MDLRHLISFRVSVRHFDLSFAPSVVEAVQLRSSFVGYYATEVLILRMCACSLGSMLVVSSIPDVDMQYLHRKTVETNDVKALHIH
jgi:hypothetical protein